MSADRPDKDKLKAVFNNAVYTIATPNGELSLRIGVDDAALHQMLREHGADSAAIITAYNPQARPQAETANQAAQTRLIERVRNLRLPNLQGRNRAEQGDGPVEPTVVVLAITQEEACRLGREFSQVAIVYVGTGAPELLWL